MNTIGIIIIIFVAGMGLFGSLGALIVEDLKPSDNESVFILGMTTIFWPVTLVAIVIGSFLAGAVAFVKGAIEASRRK